MDSPTQKQGPSKATRGLARQIRERTGDLAEQIAEMIRISLDPTHKSQVDTIKWLAERAYGRVPEISAFADLDQAEAATAIKHLTNDQLEGLLLHLRANSAADKATSESVKAA